MVSVVSPLRHPILCVMPPGIHSCSFDIRIFELISFPEENSIGRLIAVTEAFSFPVQNIMLPGGHSVSAVFRVKDLITGLKKTFPVMDKQVADHIFGIKCDFHRNLNFPPPWHKT